MSTMRSKRLRRCHRSRAQTRLAPQRSVSCPKRYLCDSAPVPTQDSNSWQAANWLCETELAAPHQPCARLLQGGKPVVAVTQQQPAGACRQVPDHLALMHVGGSQVHLGDHAWPTQAQVQAKAVKRLAAGMVFAKAGRVIEAVTTVRSCKLAHRNRQLSTMATVGS